MVWMVGMRMGMMMGIVRIVWMVGMVGMVGMVVGRGDCGSG